MTPDLLTTKLYIPAPRANMVPRPRLIQRLDEGLTQHHRLTLISAPAGFGKTTLVTDWVCSLAHEIAWISLDENDNDPVQFLSYLLAALQSVDRRIGPGFRQLLQSPRRPPAMGLLTPLINDIATVAIPFLLVLDDYHLVKDEEVHQLVHFLLNNQPQAMHIVISTREDPPIPLHQLRARGQITELKSRDLRFTGTEATTFFEQTMHLHLQPEAVTTLETRTEGWVAGMQLAALALQENPSGTHGLIETFSGDMHYILEYLVAEVLQQQPPELRDFVRRTALIERVNAALCTALTGQEDSQAFLEQLASANIFLSPLDAHREWYKYHRLLVEAQKVTLTHEEQHTLHQTASRWYAAQGMEQQAIAHALAAGDDALAEKLISEAVERMFLSGSVVTVRAWLGALPDARVRDNGELATYQGWSLALSGDLEAATDYAHMAEAYFRRLPQPENPATASSPTAYSLSKLLTLRSFIALSRQDYAEVSRLAREALDLQAEDSHWRAFALWALAEAHERTYDIAAAIETFYKAWETGRSLGNTLVMAMVETSLVLALNNYGRRLEALDFCQQAIAQHTNAEGRISPLAGLLAGRIGMLYYESNQLDLAREYYEKSAVASGRFVLDADDFTFIRGMAAFTLYQCGEAKEALEALQEAHHLAQQVGYTDADWYLAVEVDLRMRQGDLPFALRWAEKLGLTPESPSEPIHMERDIVYARLLLAQGLLPEARHWLARLEAFAESHQLYRRLITVHILLAVAADALGDVRAAQDYISCALQRAASQEYIRAFLDEDTRVLTLLASMRHTATHFVDRVLQAAGHVEDVDVPAQVLIEPLSARELEVLHLLNTGATNREIAKRLFITVGTVKRHVNNIYGKLGVHNRTQAAARARDLGLV